MINYPRFQGGIFFEMNIEGKPVDTAAWKFQNIQKLPVCIFVF